MEYQFDCYVVRVQEQPAYDPPRSSVQIQTPYGWEEITTIAHGTPTYTVVSLILAALANLPPCP